MVIVSSFIKSYKYSLIFFFFFNFDFCIPYSTMFPVHFEAGSWTYIPFGPSMIHPMLSRGDFCDMQPGCLLMSKREGNQMDF